MQIKSFKVVFILFIFFFILLVPPGIVGSQADSEESLLAPPLWLSAETVQSIIEEVSGERGRLHFRHLNLKGGYAPSPGFREIAEYVRDQAKSYGLQEVKLEGFTADGERFYWAFLTEPNWDARSGSLWQLTPRRRRLADFSVAPAALGRYSCSTEVEAELIYVGSGTRPEDYEGKDVKGKVVLASGGMGAVHAAAVYERGALGVVTIRTRDRFDHPDFLSGGSLSPWRGPKGQKPTFGFGLSYREGQALLADLERGPVRVRVEIDAEIGTGEYIEVTGVIPGSELPGEEVLLTSHIDHRNTGGNNATGTSVTLEAARVLSCLVESGILPRPRRTIRFIWGPEHLGLVIYLYHHPEVINSWLHFINVDMAGKNQSELGTRLRAFRSPHSNPTVMDDVVQEVLEWVVAGNSTPPHHARIGKFLWPILDPLGSQDDLLAYTVPFWGPGDQEDLNAGNLRIHTNLLSDWPDPYIGVHQDNPETADPTQIKRAVVIAAVSLWALANAGPREAEELAASGGIRARQRLAAIQRKTMRSIFDADKATLSREALEGRIALQGVVDTELRGLMAIEPWLEGDAEARAYIEELKTELALDGERILEAFDAYHHRRAAAIGVQAVLAKRSRAEEALRGRIPVRAKTPRGPVNFGRYRYGQAWLAKKLGNWDFRNLAILRDGYYVHYEAINFVDGKRDLLQIRDAVSAEYGPIDAKHIAEYFDVLEKAGVVNFTSPPKSNVR